MAPVWSTFNRAILGAKTASNLILNRVALRNAGQIRCMSGHNKFVVVPSRWQWVKFKDLVHLYTFAAVIPLGLISLYANVFIGPAELAPIPEGYTPKEWEYYRHPITRFFKKYIMDSEQQGYEKHLHGLWQAVDESEFRRIQKEVKYLQEARQDYKFWYYIPVETHTYEVEQQDTYEREQERSYGN